LPVFLPQISQTAGKIVRHYNTTDAGRLKRSKCLNFKHFGNLADKQITIRIGAHVLFYLNNGFSYQNLK